MELFSDASSGLLQMQLRAARLFGAAPYYGNPAASFRLRSCDFEMQVRLAQLQTAFAQGIFQRRALRIKLDVETPHLEKIGDSEKTFQVVKGLEQKIGRTCAKRRALGFLGRISGQHDDRKEDFIAGGAKGVEDRKSIHVRHHQIEQNQVWREGVTSFKGQAGIRDGP
jgi:hypothetical protein